MKVWILEQDISRGENLGRMVKRFLENAGAAAGLRCISGRLRWFQP